MNIIRLAIERPIAVVAAVLMALMFGYVALTQIPIQLAPDVEKPVITVTTSWPGAAPVEIEREIVNQQEDVFRGLEGMERMTSRSEDGRGRITLEFSLQTNMDRALLLVANRLDGIDDYPDEANEPRLSTAGSEDNPIAWFVITRLDGNERPIHTYGDFGNDVIEDHMERVPGVSNAEVLGGSGREMQVIVQPERMARYGFTVTDIVDTIRSAGISMTAGEVEEGKRRYVVRTEGDFTTPEQVSNVVLRTLEDPNSGRLGRVTVGDIAEVRFDYKDAPSYIRVLGERALAMRITRETGANVIETMEGIREAVEDLNSYALPSAGLKIEQVYDETIYINSAIQLVTQNIYIGGALAAIVLLLFLRSFGATLIVSVAIPVSVVASFVAMAFLGRSINVISLAGIAFAVGMVVDAAIVVLENIYRLRQAGFSRREAAYQGAAQVWGAVLVSAMTTVMVFIPILVMKLEVGQLFRDIAVAISVSVLLSLLVAVTLIPAMANRLLGGADDKSITRLRLPIIDDFAAMFSSLLMRFTQKIVASRMLAICVVLVITASAGFVSYKFLPKLEYLPEGNRNLVFGFILPPPGYNLDTMADIAGKVEEAIKPLWASVTGPESEPGDPPKIDRFFFAAFRANVIMGASAVEGGRASELINPLREPIFREPGTFGFIRQPSIFGRGIGGARAINLDISGSDLNTILAVAVQALVRVNQVLPPDQGNQIRPRPGLELGAPEVRLVPDRVRLADAGIPARLMAMSIDTFNDGLRIAEITVDGEQIDLTLKGPEDHTAATQGIESLPIVTAAGQILPASSLASIEITAGPTEIRHIESQRTVTLSISPSPQLPLEQALDILETEVIAPMTAEGLPPDISLGLSGTADKLAQTFSEMQLNLILALVIVYLVMAVLFESFVYPLIILFSVPVAAAGGVVGLAILNTIKFQPLDMLTLLGFVILIGIVVNNAILLVHQALYLMREEGLSQSEAILESTRNRLRPIFMSTLTSVFGMLPLVLFPGAGSELYRGLGSVVVGGLSLSALLTLLLIPPLLSLVMIGEKRRQPKQVTGEAIATPAE